jgi:hypothetical protein
LSISVAAVCLSACEPTDGNPARLHAERTTAETALVREGVSSSV